MSKVKIGSRSVALLFLYVLAQFGLGNTREARAEDLPPNIIMILVDDQSWNGTSVRMDPDDPLSASDFYQTPNLESLAADGMRFSNAYSAASICSPTRSALLTGRSPGQLGVTDIVHPSGIRGFGRLPLTSVEWRSMETTLETLPQRVKAGDSRYVTGQVGKWHMEPDDPILMGYDHYNPAYRDAGIGSEDPGSVFARTVAANAFIDDRVAANEPFFLSLSHFAVHEPIEGQASVIEKYEGLEPGDVHTSNVYAAFTEALDTAVGQLLDHVDNAGLSDNTYIIYASDNGAVNRKSANYPLSGQKQHLMDGGIRTPLIIKGPGITANSSSSTPVTTVDLYATISDFAGNTTPFQDGVEGASLQPLLDNDGSLPAGMEYLERQYSENGAIFFAQPHNLAYSGNYRIRPMLAVRAGNYKLLRIQGENGNPDQDYLFDFDANLAESETASSLDLSGTLPEKTAELGSLLDNWVQLADVSLAYDVAKPTEVVWQADNIGSRPDRWRAVTDIDHRWRETFETVPDANHPFQVSVQTHLVNAPDAALDFAGSEGLGRRFFHVGNRAERVSSRFPTGEADFDHSVTFEALVRLDDLSNDHMLFESGVPSEGLSLTIGDADNDGQHNDARFRVVSSLGDEIEVTAKIDQFASPTRDFILLSAVVNDDPNDRYIELFVNGASAGKTNGTLGDTMLLWNGFKQGFTTARLGYASAAALGANSGSGELPFNGASLRGELASFRFYNQTSSASMIQENYAALLASTSHGITSVSGGLEVPTERPSSIAAGDFELDGAVRIMHERVAQFDLNQPLDAVATKGDEIVVSPPNAPTSGTLAANVSYNSYLFHYDGTSIAVGDVSLTGSVTFDSPIVGLILEESSLDATEKLLGVAGRHDEGDRNLADNGSGSFQISDDLLTLEIDISLDAASLTQFRVLTLATPSLPGDYNNDGMVNATDYDVWRSEFGTNSASLADGNRDGSVNIADYTVWRDNLGSMTDALASQSSGKVPEPGGFTLILVTLGLIGLAARRGNASH